MAKVPSLQLPIHSLFDMCTFANNKVQFNYSERGALQLYTVNMQSSSFFIIIIIG